MNCHTPCTKWVWNMWRRNNIPDDDCFLWSMFGALREWIPVSQSATGGHRWTKCLNSSKLNSCSTKLRSILGYSWNWYRCHASNCLRHCCLSARQSGTQTLLIYHQTDLSVPESRLQTIPLPNDLCVAGAARQKYSYSWSGVMAIDWGLQLRA